MISDWKVPPQAKFLLWTVNMERAGTFGSKGYVEEGPLPAGRELGYAACKDTGFLLGG